MSEKRFVLCKKGDKEYIEDNGCVQLYGFDVLCEMLNEQQSIIRRDEISIKTMMSNMKKLEEENEQLRKELDNFKPVMFQDMQKGTVRLYSKGGNDE